MRAETFWDKQADNYDASTGKFKEMFSRTADKTRKYLKTSDTVLELGCGTGRTTLELAGNVKNISAIDISAKMLEIAKEKADRRQIKNIEFHHTTIFDMNFREETYDVILAYNVLFLLIEKKDTIERIKSLLKPGGYLISVSPCIRQRTLAGRLSITLLFSLLNVFRIYSTSHAALSFSDYENMITDGGLAIVETEDLHTDERHYFIAARK